MYVAGESRYSAIKSMHVAKERRYVSINSISVAGGSRCVAIKSICVAKESRYLAIKRISVAGKRLNKILNLRDLFTDAPVSDHLIKKLLIRRHNRDRSLFYK